MKVININAIWCPSCISMHSIWEEIKEEVPDLEIEDIDYDIDEDIVKQYKPGKVLPVSILFKDEMEETRIIGEKTKEEILKIIEAYK